MEIELKLDVASADAGPLLASALFAGAESRQMTSVYFDTPALALRSAGFSLRVRHVDDRRIQTVKADGAAAAGLFVRDEWEHEIAGDWPLVDDPANPLAAHLGSKALAGVAPVFRTEITRITAIRKGRKAAIELVLDRGEIVAAERPTPVCEVELELLRGSPAALFALARKLDAIAPVRLGVLGKSERGYRLADGTGMRPVKSHAVALTRDMTTATAFQAIAAACIRQFRLNEMLLGEADDAGALHQARVALRRLRSALSLFRPMLADARFGHLRGELRWIAGILGEARNIDVLVARFVEETVLARLREGRARAYADASTALASPRLRRLMLDLAEWLALGAWLTNPDAAELRDRPIVHAAANSLDRYRKRVKRRGADLLRLDDENRHELRIEAKKLRYAAEFFASLYTGKKAARRAKRFGAALEALQKHLGDLNDLATMPTVLAKLGIPDAEGPDSGSPARFAKSLKKADDAYDRLMDAKRFWR